MNSRRSPTRTTSLERERSLARPYGGEPRKSSPSKSRNGSTSPRRKRSDDRRKVQPEHQPDLNESFCSEADTFLSGASSMIHREPKNKPPGKPKRTSSSSSADRRDKTHEKRPGPNRHKSSKSSKRHPNQDSIGESTFGGSSFANDSLDMMGAMRSSLNSSGPRGVDSFRTEFDVDTPSGDFSSQSRNVTGEDVASVANASILSELEGLSEEQKAWAGIARVLEAYGDNSVATNEVLSPAVRKALADSDSSRNPKPTIKRHDGHRGEIDEEESEEEPEDDNATAMKKMCGLNGSKPAASEMPELMESSFSSVATDLLSLTPSTAGSCLSGKGDMQRIVQQVSSQEENLKTFIDDVADMIRNKEEVDPEPAQSGRNMEIFDTFSGDQRKASAETAQENIETFDNVKENGTSVDASHEQKDDPGRHKSRRNKKSASPDKSSRHRSSASRPSASKDSSRMKSSGDPRGHRPPRESRKTRKAEPAPTSEERGDKRKTKQPAQLKESQHSENTQPFDLSDFHGLANDLASKEDSLPPDKSSAPSIEEGVLQNGTDSWEPIATSQTNLSVTHSSSQLLKNKARVMSNEDQDRDEDEDDFDEHAPYLASMLTAGRDHFAPDSPYNNSMPSLDTFKDDDLRCQGKQQEKWLSYGDLGYEEAYAEGPSSPVPSRLHESAGALEYSSPLPSPRGPSFFGTTGRQQLSGGKAKKKLMRQEKTGKVKKRKKKKSPPESNTDSTEAVEPAEDIVSPDDFHGFFHGAEEQGQETPKVENAKPKVKRLQRMGAFLATPLGKKSPRKSLFKETPLALLRKGVMKLPFLGRKKRAAQVIDTGRRDAQFYPGMRDDEDEESNGALLG
jgi:hypothetical protein